MAKAGQVLLPMQEVSLDLEGDHPEATGGDDKDRDSKDEDPKGTSSAGLQDNDENLVPLLDLPGPPDGGWGWVVCFACFMCNMIVDGICYSFGILMEPLIEHFGASRSSVSLVGALLPGVYMLSGPLVGGLTNKFGCRKVCVVGGVFSCLALVLSIFAPNVATLTVTYGVMGGFGMGLVYLPAVVCCGYYFEKRRALATGISVCGSGVGCFLFAPLTNALLVQYGWRGTNLIFAGLCLNCCVFGSLMRPLELVVIDCNTHKEGRGDDKVDDYGGGDNDNNVVSDPAIQVQHQQQASGANRSFFVPDKILKVEEDKDQQGHDHHHLGRGGRKADEDLFGTKVAPPARNLSYHHEDLFRRAQHHRAANDDVLGPPKGLPIRKRHMSTPHLGLANSRVGTSGPPGGRHLAATGHLIHHNNQYMAFGIKEGARTSLQPSRRKSVVIVRPLSRKDVFLSRMPSFPDGPPLPEQQEQQEQRHSLHKPSMVVEPKGSSLLPRGSIVASHLSLAFDIPSDRDDDLWLSQEVKKMMSSPLLNALREMIDLTHLTKPLFLLICLSNVLGFLAVYIPYMYLPDMMTAQRGLGKESASTVISLVGVANTLGRVVIGAIVDSPRVSSLLVTNVSLVLSGCSVLAFPFCVGYESFVTMALFLGFSVSAYISLTSIVLVDLLGLDSLTSTFGLLVLFRGVASIVGPPLAGLIFDVTGNYDNSFYMAGTFFIVGGLVSEGARMIQGHLKRGPSK